MTRARAYLFMALHVSLAAGTYVFGKPAAVEFPDPEALALARATVAAVLVLLATGTLIPPPRFTRREWLQVAGLGLLLVPLNQYTFLRGLKDTAPSHPALIYSMTPVGVMLLSSVVQRRAPPRARVVGVLLALAGVIVLLRPWEESADAVTLRRGDLWVCVGLVIWVVYTTVAGILTRRHDARVVTAWALVIGALLLAPVALPSLLRMDFAAVSVRGWVGLAWLAAVTSTLMMLLWNSMLGKLEPVQVAICANAQPAATAALAAGLAAIGYLRGDQDLGPLFWTGTSLVLLGVWLVQRRG
jgi:drug/metabolite transporter (DMT)-like permease